MSDFLWKPASASDGNLAVLSPGAFSGGIKTVSLVGPGGQVLDTGRYTPGDSGDRSVFRFPKPGGAYPSGTQVKFEFDQGGGATYSIGNPGSRVEGGSPSYFGGGDKVAQNYAGGSQKESFTGAFGGGSSGVSALPFYLGSQYPQFNPASFPGASIETFKFTDPNKYAQEIGGQNLTQINKNFDTANDMALKSLRTELAGLKEFVPAAAALSREQTSIDNQFNTQQRGAQVRSALPGVEGDLRKQNERANLYAEGKLPTSALDTGFELGVRGRAGDQATFAGFGGGSAAARNTSDIMSAEERFQIGQYGEQLLGQNIKTKADLFLPPTEYANTGSQVKVTPEVGAARLAYQGAGMLNDATILNPAQALSAKMGQEQFIANGLYDASKFNSVGTFEASLGKFQYDVGFLTQTQAANQANLNAAWSVNTMGIGNSNAAAGLSDAQAGQTIRDVGGAIGATSGLWDSIGSLLGGGGTGGSTGGGSSPAEITGTPSVSGESFQLSSPDVSAPRIPRESASQVTGFDASAPTAIKIAQGGSAPAGYTQVGGSNGGFAVNTQAYTQDLERFAKFGGDTGGQISVSNAAQADKMLTTAAKLSYVPLPKFQPISTLSNGKQVYSLPSAANSGDILAGVHTNVSTANILGSLGVGSPEMLKDFQEVNNHIVTLPQSLEGKTQGEVFQGINKAFNLSTKDLKNNPEAQQAHFMAGRIAELWPNLSPEQKSAGLAAVGNLAIQSKVGSFGEKEVPFTSGSPAAPLKVGDVMRLTSKGVNGFSLARNYRQLGGLSKAAVGGKSVDDVAFVAHQTGMLGFGPQGASVKVSAKELQSVGAQPAPEFGVGAAVFLSASSVPANYSVLTKTPDNKVIALPKNLQHTATFGTGGAGPLAFEKATQVSQGTHPAQRLWIDDGNKVIRGSVGGSAIVSGINIMKKANPSAMGGMIAYSLFHNSMARG